MLLLAAAPAVATVPVAAQSAAVGTPLHLCALHAEPPASRQENVTHSITTRHSTAQHSRAQRIMKTSAFAETGCEQEAPSGTHMPNGNVTLSLHAVMWKSPHVCTTFNCQAWRMQVMQLYLQWCVTPSVLGLPVDTRQALNAVVGQGISHQLQRTNVTCRNTAHTSASGVSARASALCVTHQPSTVEHQRHLQKIGAYNRNTVVKGPTGCLVRGPRGCLVQPGRCATAGDQQTCPSPVCRFCT